MKHRVRLFIMGSLVLSGLSVKSQTAVPAAGGNGNGTGGSVSYSVGQIVYTEVTGINGSIIQGVQQPYEISVVTGNELIEIELGFSVYPNPATDFLTLKISKYNSEKYEYRLFNITGSLLQKDKVVTHETQINMQEMRSGTYFLKVISCNKEVKSFKIIKN